MRSHKDEAAQLLTLARVLKEKVARARWRNPELAARMTARLNAVLARVSRIEAGCAPSVWPSSPGRYRSDSRASHPGPFGCHPERFAMVRAMGIDCSIACSSMIGRG